LNLNISASIQNIKNLLGNFGAIYVGNMHANFQVSSFTGVGEGDRRKDGRHANRNEISELLPCFGWRNQSIHYSLNWIKQIKFSAPVTLSILCRTWVPKGPMATENTGFEPQCRLKLFVLKLIIYDIYFYRKIPSSKIIRCYFRFLRKYYFACQCDISCWKNSTEGCFPTNILKGLKLSHCDKKSYHAGPAWQNYL